MEGSDWSHCKVQRMVCWRDRVVDEEKRVRLGRMKERE